MSALLRLCVSGGLAYCSYAMCRLPLLPLYARSLGATPQMVGLVVGASTIVQGVGQAAGPIIAGYLMAGGDFDRVFLVSGALGLCALAILWGWRHDPPRDDAAVWWRRAAAGVREVMRDRRILAVSLAQAGQFFVNGTVSAFVPLFAYEMLSLPAPQIGILFGIQTVTTVLARPLAGTFSDRVGRRPLVFSGLLMCAAALGGVSMATGFWSLAACTALYGAAVAVTHSAASAYVTDLARQARYGAAHGVFGTIYDVGDAAGPLAGGFLVAAAGYETTFRSVALAVAILSVVFLVVSRHWHGGDGLER